MKPSISIDLPGWCTLRKDTANTDDELLQDVLDDHTARSAGGRDDLDSGASSSGNNASGNIIAGGGNGGDSDDDDDDDGDGDGSIARLFSIGGLKRRMSGPESRQQARTKRRQAGSGSTGFDLRAEAYIDWPCVRCTFINTYDREACQGCGGANVKREKLLRERRREVERLGRLQSARECRDRSLKEEAMKDVLEDSDSEDGDGSHPQTTPYDTDGATDTSVVGAENRSQVPPPTSGERASSSPVTQEADSRSSSTTPASQLDSTLVTGEQQQQRGRVCFIGTLPPDLLLQCAEFLGSTRTLCRLREVSFGWLLSLDGREAGRRLWRPVFYRLRASGSIHAGTDVRGQQRRQLKVYDLGAASPATSDTSSALESGAGVATTPSPAQRSVIGFSSAGNRCREAGAGAGTTTASGVGGSARCAGGGGGGGGGNGNGNGRRASACLVCGLIQREGYGGKDCEMCASSLVLVQGRGSPATPRVAYTRVNISGRVGGSSSLLSSSSSSSSTGAIPAEQVAASPSPNVSSTCRVSPARQGRSYCGDAGGGGSGLRMKAGSDAGADEEDEAGGSDVDWHFLVKRLAEEKRIAAGWGSLQHGWLWLQRALQGILSSRRGDEKACPSPPRCTVAGSAFPGVGCRTGPDSPTPGRPEGAGASESGPRTVGRGAVAVGLGELDPTIARLVRKLAGKKWVVLYDSLKATFALQAQGLAREVGFAAMAVVDNEAALDSSGRRGLAERERTENFAVAIAGVQGCIAAWQAYKDWCEEVDVYCELLNEQISAERYRTAGAGCGRGDHTPFIREAALLSFRHSFALNVQICALLRMAISKGMPSSAQPDNPSAGDSTDLSRRQGISERSAHSSRQADPSGLASSAGIGDADEIFTDLELMEDSRAIDFSVRSFSGRGGGGAGAAGAPRGVSGRRERASLSGRCGGGSSGGGSIGSMRSARRGHYYDWFLTKLEGKEAGIIRGDMDARGESVVRRSGGADGRWRDGGAGAGTVGGGGRLHAAALEELLELVRDMVEELDVPDDHLSKDRLTQGAMRRLLLLPIKRWQAAASVANTEDPQNLLMAGLSPAPGNEGFHRLRGGAAGRRKGTPPMSALGKDAGKSWEQLSTFFG